MPDAPLCIRPAVQNDLEILWTFLAMAAYEPSVAAAQGTPIVALHLKGWQGPHDFGFVAQRAGSVLGAAWARQFLPSDEPTFYVDERTPELSIAVRESARGQGIGAVLLAAMIDEAQRRRVGLCLNVRSSNPAIKLYERAGFQRVHGSEIRNRVGGFSIGMLFAESS